MTAAAAAAADRRERPPRNMDGARVWVPIVLSLASTLVALMLAYGRIGSRLDLIEWRLMKIEERMASKP